MASGPAAGSYTASDGAAKCVQVLLAAGADLRARDYDGETAFAVAMALDRFKIAAALAITDDDFVDATLREAAEHGDQEAVEEAARALIADGKRTAVHWLARSHEKYAPFLGRIVAQDRSLGALRDADGHTPLEVAKRECKAAIQSALFFLVRSLAAFLRLSCGDTPARARLKERAAHHIDLIFSFAQGRYELLSPNEPKHRSATCVVHFAKVRPPAAPLRSWTL